MKRAVSTLASLSLAAAASAQIQSQKLIASDNEYEDFFGRAVAVSGDWAIVGAPLEDDVAEQSGAAYVYHRNGSGWIETQKLKASDPDFGDAFGWSVALSGATAVVAAPTDAPGVSGAGSVYVFDLVGGTWAQTAKLWASDAIPAAHFGDTVACRDDRIVVGAREDDGAGYQAGAAYVFDRVGTAWMESAKLVANDAAAFDFLGASVSVFGDVVLLGAPEADGPAGSQGAAYVFEQVGGGWAQTAKLVASDAAHGDFFGTAIAIDGTRALVTATAHDHWGVNTGSVYVFDRQGSLWTEVAEFGAVDATAQERMGHAISLADDLMIVGAVGDDDVGSTAGCAYAFRHTGSSWIQIGKLLARDGSMNDNIGLAVSISDGRVLIGALGDDEACPSNILCNSGSAYVFDLAPDAVQYGHCASAAPCANADPHGGCVNSTGRGAILAAGGSSSVASDELVLEARDLPPDKSAIVFMGGGQTQVPLGDGLRVVTTGGVGLRRFPMQTSDAEGWLTFGPGIAGQTQGLTSTSIAAGSVWNFQCWYRDPAGPCANATNLTNGVQVAFTP